MQKLPFHRRITVKLTAIMGVLVLCGALAGAITSIQLAQREFFHIMGQQFDSTFIFAENSLDIVGQMARTWGQSFANDPALSKQLKATHAEVQRKVESMREHANCDAVIALDSRGRIIHHSAFPEKDGESLMSWSIVRQAVNEGRSSYAIIEESGNFIIYGSGLAPKNRDGSRDHIVLTGFKISDALVSELSKDTSIELTFVRRTAVMASSFNTSHHKLIDSPVAFLDYQLLYNQPHLTKEVMIGEESYFASVRQLRLLDPGMDGSLLLTYPTNELDMIIHRLQQGYLWLFALGMLVFIFFGWLISSRIMSPLRKLSARAQQIAQGDLSPTHFDLNDEIGNIASSFNDLMSELATNKQKVEQHAEELELLVTQRTYELSLANEELTKQATHDVLTGLPNRKLFNDRLHQAVMLSHRNNVGLALMFIDLDRFKWVNDTFGHAAGDELLVETARRIQTCLREGDTFARLGGDEFTVVLPQPGTRSDIENVAERILNNLTTPFDLSVAPDTRISGSIGIAVYPESGDSAAKLLLHADQAMYRAKESGRATYHFWAPLKPAADQETEKTPKQ